MGNRVSRVVGGCFDGRQHDHDHAEDVVFSEPLEEGLGHSFCYVRHAMDSPSYQNSSDLSLSERIGVDPDGLDSGPLSQDQVEYSAKRRAVQDRPKTLQAEKSFKAISGASVSANTSAPRSILTQEQFGSFPNVSSERPAAFESTCAFTSLPLQPIPKGGSVPVSGPISGSLFVPASGPLERGFLSGPLERGFLSGPLEKGYLSGPLEGMDPSQVSSNNSGYIKRSKSLARFVKRVSKPMKRAFARNVSEFAKDVAKVEATGQGKDGHKDSKMPPLREMPLDSDNVCVDSDVTDGHNLQWAQGKAGEDRVHVVLSEENGWLFVGIYDGFSGPDAPDFLMSNLYPAIYKELKGILWDTNEEFTSSRNTKNDSIGLKLDRNGSCGCISESKRVSAKASSRICGSDSSEEIQGALQREAFGVPAEDLADSCANIGCSGSVCQAIATCEQESYVNTTSWNPVPNKSCNMLGGQMMELGSTVSEPDGTCNYSNGSALPGGKLEQVDCKSQNKNKMKLLRWKHDQQPVRIEAVKMLEGKVMYDSNQQKSSSRGIVDHSAILSALARALEVTELSYLEMAEKAVAENPELALVGSCVLVMLMKDENVYIMNVGDSRAVLAQNRKMGLYARGQQCCQSNANRPEDHDQFGARDSMLRMELERIIEETPFELEALESSYDVAAMAPPASSPTLSAFQLSSDHSTSIEKEVWRLKEEHPDDPSSISNDRVKGKLKVTRAFGAGFLKKAKWNNALLEVFRIEYIGNAPYITCIPSLYHHRLGPQDRFLVLSSDGLYEYLSNEEVISHVEWFMENFPDGDPAQYLIEKLLFRAAKKAGMDFHELLDIPHGDRRKYHDDVSVMVISLEGRIWRSFG